MDGQRLHPNGAPNPEMQPQQWRLPVVENEQHARTCGRMYAKEIFQPMRWKRIATQPEEDAQLFESVSASSSSRTSVSNNSNNTTYCVRAVRKLQASISEVETVLERSARHELLAQLLPQTYASGGCVNDYGQLEHKTGEREHANVQYVRFRPYASMAGSYETHLLLEYTLTTHLRRSSIKKDGKKTSSSSDNSTQGGRTPVVDMASVPSILHLLRPVYVPNFGAATKRREFEHERLSTNAFSITYIIQEQTPETVSLEVILSCTASNDNPPTGQASDPQQQRRNNKLKGLSQKNRQRQDALHLTRLQSLILSNRQSDRHSKRQPTQFPAPHDPMPSRLQTQQQMQNPQSMAAGTTTDPSQQARPSRFQTFAIPPAVTASFRESEASVITQTGRCGICRKRFGPFRWKHRCEVCDKSVCDQCLSVIANPTAARKKKRVCNSCLFGSANIGGSGGPSREIAESGSSLPGAAAPTSQPQTKAPSLPVQAVPVQQQRETIGNMPRSSSRDNLVTGSSQPHHPRTQSSHAPAVPVPPAANRSSRRYSVPVTSTSTTIGSGNMEQRRPPPPVPGLQNYNHYVRRTGTSRKMYRQPPDCSDSEGSYYSEDEFTKPVNYQQPQLPSIRARRAKTVTIEDVPTKSVAASTKSFPMAPSYRCSYSNIARTPPPPPSMQEPPNSTSVSAGRTKTQFHQLKTPKADYDYDFHWFNIFPKAPIASTSDESDRLQLLQTQLKIDEHSIVFLRNDPDLEQLAHRVLDVATQWHGCSINIVSARDVFCLVNASADMDASSITTTFPAVVVQDVMPREESASAYAVYHRSPFFVPELSKDDRFMAHPLHTDHDAVSLLSLPLYLSTSMFNSLDDRHCIGTLDLWKLDHVAASSYVSQEWWRNMEALMLEISARIEVLARESHHFLKPRSKKAYSVESSCDSRSSTRRADSFDMDLYEAESELAMMAINGLSPTSSVSSIDRLTSLPFTKGRSASLFADKRTWQYSDSDNESTTSNTSRSSRTSRSSQRYSAAELHSTIESLLHQANETSHMTSNLMFKTAYNV